MTSIEKSMLLLSQFEKEPHVYTVAELANITGINRTTVYRDICTLEEYGLLMRVESGKAYTIGSSMFHMGGIYLQMCGCHDQVLALLRELALKVSASVGLARRENEKVITLYSVEADAGGFNPHGRPGALHPVYKGVYGKGLMAYWEQEKVCTLLDELEYVPTGPNTLCKKEDVLEEYERIRKQGFATSIEDFSPGLVGVGVPLVDTDGVPKSMLAVAFEKDDDYMMKIWEYRETLQEYGAQIEPYLQ